MDYRKMILIKLFLLMLVVSFTGIAGTLDEIESIESNKSVNIPKSNMKNDASKVMSKKANNPLWINLSNGKRVDVQRWQIVHFISSNCPYCHQFNPVIKKVSDMTGIPIFVYSFDGEGDAVFPHVLPTTTDVTNGFFAELPKVTPTDFITNKDTLVTIPLSQGAISEEAFIQRLDETFTLADRLGVL